MAVLFNNRIILEEHEHNINSICDMCMDRVLYVAERCWEASTINIELPGPHKDDKSKQPLKAEMERGNTNFTVMILKPWTLT